MSESSAQPDALVIDDAASEFIKSVELAPVSVEQASELAAALNLDYTAFVNTASILYLPIPEQQKTDSLYWTTFARLATDAKIHHLNDPVAWDKEYFRVLALIGMKPLSRSRNSAVVSGGSSVDALVLRFLKPFWSPDGQGNLDKIINALSKGKNKDALAIFNSSSSDSSTANFQVSDGTVDKDLNLSIHATSMNFKTNEHIMNLLFWHFQGNLTINYSSEHLSLSKTTADRNRKEIYDRVNIRLRVVGIDLD